MGLGGKGAEEMTDDTPTPEESVSNFDESLVRFAEEAAHYIVSSIPRAIQARDQAGPRKMNDIEASMVLYAIARKCLATAMSIETRLSGGDVSEVERTLQNWLKSVDAEFRQKRIQAERMELSRFLEDRGVKAVDVFKGKMPKI